MKRTPLPSRPVRARKPGAYLTPAALVAALMLAVGFAGCIVVEAPQPGSATPGPGSGAGGDASATPGFSLPDIPQVGEVTPASRQMRPAHQHREEAPPMCAFATWNDPALHRTLANATPEKGISASVLSPHDTFGVALPELEARFGAGSHLLHQVVLAWPPPGQVGSSVYLAATSASWATGGMPFGTSEARAREHFAAWAGNLTHLDDAAEEQAWKGYWESRRDTSVQVQATLSPVPQLHPLELWARLHQRGLRPSEVDGMPGSYLLGEWRFDVRFAHVGGFWGTPNGNVTLEADANGPARATIEAPGLTARQAEAAWRSVWEFLGLPAPDVQPGAPASCFALA